MKSTTAAVSAILALLPALGSSTPIAARDDIKAFTMIATHSGNPNVHLRAINANGGLFWIGRDTSTFCPDVVEVCPPGVDTVLLQGAGSTTLSPSVEVPGGQAVYISGPDAPTPGAWTFNSAHSAPPVGSKLATFKFDGTDLFFEGSDWYACPAEGAYFVTAVEIGTAAPEFCIGINVYTSPYTGPQPAAWQYD